MTQHTLKVNTAFPVLSHLALSHDHGFPCFVFHRNPDQHDVMKDYHSRLHVRLIKDTLLVANLYTEMYSIS